MTASSDGDHSPIRPSWACRACGVEWPCPSAKEQMRGELSPSQLSTQMYVFLESAARDMPRSPAYLLFARFLHWTWVDPDQVIE